MVEETTSLPTFEAQTEEIFQGLYNQINQTKLVLGDVASQVKSLQKNYQKDMKHFQKLQKSRKKREPSGFAKPSVISKELCDFLGKPYGTEMARTEVTKELTTYIKSHNLQDNNNKRIILPDKKLTKLLKVTKSDELTYFNLQKWMKPHFPSKSA